MKTLLLLTCLLTACGGAAFKSEQDEQSSTEPEPEPEPTEDGASPEPAEDGAVPEVEPEPDTAPPETDAAPPPICPTIVVTWSNLSATPCYSINARDLPSIKACDGKTSCVYTLNYTADPGHDIAPDCDKILKIEYTCNGSPRAATFPGLQDGSVVEFGCECS